MLLVFAQGATALETVIDVSAGGSAEYYVNDIYQVTIYGVGYDIVELNDGDMIFINTSANAGYVFDKICFDVDCVYYTYDQSFYGAIHADTLEYYIMFTALPTNQITDVHGSFTSTDPTNMTYNLFWTQSMASDVFIYLDGYEQDLYYYTAGAHFYSLFYVIPYGLHEFCVNDVCTTGTNIEPVATPTPTPAPTATPAPIPTNPILTIVQIVGNGSLEVYDNDELIGNILTSHNFNVGVGHNVRVVAHPNAGYHVEKICDYSGCIADSTKTTLISNLDFITITAHFISDSVIPPIPTPPPNTTGYTLSIANTPIGMGKVMLWLDGQQQSDITSSMSYNLAPNTDVELSYYPYSGANYLKNATINGVVNTTTIFSMTKNYTVVAHWTEDISPNPSPTVPGQTPQPTYSFGNNQTIDFESRLNMLGGLMTDFNNALSPGTKLLLSAILIIFATWKFNMPGLVAGLIISALFWIPIWLTVLGVMAIIAVLIYMRGNRYG